TVRVVFTLLIVAISTSHQSIIFPRGMSYREGLKNNPVSMWKTMVDGLVRSLRRLSESSTANWYGSTVGATYLASAEQESELVNCRECCSLALKISAANQASADGIIPAT